MAIEVNINLPFPVWLCVTKIDLEFKTISAEFVKPTVNDFLDNTIEFDYTQSPFYSVFSMLGGIMQMEEEEEEAQEYQLSSRQFQLSKYTMEDIIGSLLRQVHLDTPLWAWIPFLHLSLKIAH